MKEGLSILSKSQTNNLILFIHGFTGNSDFTWGSQSNSFPSMLAKNKGIALAFDIGVFEYYTRLTQSKVTFDNISSFLKKEKRNKNLSIDELQELLNTQFVVSEKNYENVVIIAHSMGGLLSKAFILNKLFELLPCWSFIIFCPQPVSSAACAITTWKGTPILA